MKWRYFNTYKGVCKAQAVYPSGRRFVELEIVESQCSNCGRYSSQIMNGSLLTYSYCPWCGAKSDEEK